MKSTTKRMIAMCLALLLTLTTLGAAVPLTAAQTAELPSYDVQAYYQSKAPDESKRGSIVAVDQTDWLWQFGYYNSEVGYRTFNTMFCDEDRWQMTQDAPSGSSANWDYGDYALPGRYIYPASSYDSAVTFNAPMRGTVKIESTTAWAGGGSTDGVRFAVYAGKTRLWPTDAEWADATAEKNNRTVVIPEIKVALRAGEQLHFRINCNETATGDMTCWYPTITYISTDYLSQYAPGADETLPTYKVTDGYPTPVDSEQGKVVSIDQTGNIWTFGYYSEAEGYQLFNHQFYSNGQWRMTTDSTGSENWSYGAYALDNNIYPAGGRDNAVTFTAPKEGTVTVAETIAWVGGATTDGIRIAVYADDTKIWPTDSDWCAVDETNEKAVNVPAITVALHAGEQLHFRINCNGSSQNDNTCWYPTVTYISTDYQSKYAPGGSQEPEEPEEPTPELPVKYDVKDGYALYLSDADAAQKPNTLSQSGVWQFGYYNTTSGYGLFDALFYEDNDWRMTKNYASGTNWDYGRYSLEFICPANNNEGVSTFTALYDGVYTVDAATAMAHKESNGGAKIAIYADSIRLWPMEENWTYLAPGVETTVSAIKVSLHKGETLRFRTNCNGNAQNDNVTWYPVVNMIDSTYDEAFAPKDPDANAYPFTISGTQGDEWYYLYAEAGDDMLYFQSKFADGKWWNAKNDFSTGMISDIGLHPGDYDAVLAFKAPYSGTIKVSFENNKIESVDKGADADGVKFGVFSSTDEGLSPLYPTNGEMLLVPNGGSQEIQPFKRTVRKNELILFRVNKNGNGYFDMLSCVPTIRYLSTDETDTGYDDPLKPDTGKKEVYEAGPTGDLPAAPNTASATAITAEAFKALLQSGSVSGAYALSETLVFDGTEKKLSIDLSGAVLTSSASPAVLITAKNFTLTGLALEASGAVAVEVADTDEVQLLSCYIGGAVSITGSTDIRIASSVLTGTLKTNAMTGLTVEDSRIDGAVTLAAADSTLSHNDFAGSMTLTGKENVLIYANKIAETVTFQSVNNSVLLKNEFAGTGKTVSVTTTNNISIAENTFAASAGAVISLTNAEIALITGNTYRGSTDANASIYTAVNCGKVYGGNIPGVLDGKEHAGADESKLPADRTSVFDGMEPKTTVRYNGKEVSVNTYIKQASRKQRDVVLQPGVYQLDSITFAMAKNINLYGYGILLEFKSYTKKAINMSGCEKIAVKGITMDHQQVSNAQGTVLSVNGKTVVWMPDEGYNFDLNDPDMFHANAAATAFRKGSDLPYADVSFTTDRIKDEKGAYTLTGANTLQVGDRIMFRGVFCDVNYLYQCSHITYEDVTVWDGSGFAIRELEGEGYTTLNRFAVTPGRTPAGATEKRLISTCDATHSTNIRHGITVTNSLLEHMNDDGANINGTFGNVTDFDAETKTLTFQATPDYQTTTAIIEAGDQLRIMTKEGLILRDTTAAQAQEDSSVVLTDSFEMPDGEDVVLQNLSASGDGFSYDNCIARNNRSRGFLIQSLNGKLTHCTAANNGMAGILISAGLKSIFAECGYNENITVEKCLVTGNGYFAPHNKEYSSIVITSDSTRTDKLEYQTNKDIKLIGNEIVDRCSDYAIYVKGAQDVQILNNKFGTRKGVSDDTAAVLEVVNSTKVKIEGNTFPASVKYPIRLSGADAEGNDIGTLSSTAVSGKLSTCYADGKWTVRLALTNLTDKTKSGTWNTVSPEDMFGTPVSGTFELAAGETKVYSIPVQKTALELTDPDDLAEVTVAYCVQDASTEYNPSYNIAELAFAFAAKTDEAITVDASGSEAAWKNAGTLYMNRKNQTSVLPGWDGTDDLSAEIRFLWDEKNLYFYAEVTDDVHAQPETYGSVWLGDSFQMAFSPDGSTNYAELCWALGNDGNVYAYCGTNKIVGTTQSADGSIPGGQCMIRRDEDAKKTVYEVAIPWMFIGLNGKVPESGSSIHFAALLNDNDGTGRKGYMNIFDGIGQGKDPNKYGTLCMSEASGSETPDNPDTEGWYEVGEYKGTKPASEWTAPEQIGKVFAGWFTDESCAEGYTGTTGTAYAKFVDAQMLKLTALVTKSGTRANLRLITTVDSLRYDSVGFMLTTRGTTKDLGSATVYKQIAAKQGDKKVTLLPQQFCDDAQYFMTTVYKSIPSSKFNDSIEIRPYWVTLDGTRVYGEAVTLTIADALQ